MKQHVNTWYHRTQCTMGLDYILYMFNATFNNISVILLWSVLSVEETGVPRENHRSVACHWQIVSHTVVWSTRCYETSIRRPRHWKRIIQFQSLSSILSIKKLTKYFDLDRNLKQIKTFYINVIANVSRSYRSKLF